MVVGVYRSAPHSDLYPLRPNGVALADLAGNHKMSLRLELDPAFEGSVEFTILDPQTQQSVPTVENMFPFSLVGDVVELGTITYRGWRATIGQHTVHIRVFAGKDLGGNELCAISESFEVIARRGPTPPAPSPAPAPTDFFEVVASRSPTPTPTAPAPAPAPTDYCPVGYSDYGTRYDWGLGSIVITDTHQACSERCTAFSHPRYMGGCKAYQTGTYYGMLYCRSYGGNLRTRSCASWANPMHRGTNSGALGSRHAQTNQVNVGGNCCSNTTSVIASLGLESHPLLMLMP